MLGEKEKREEKVRELLEIRRNVTRELFRAKNSGNVIKEQQKRQEMLEIERKINELTTD